MPDLTTAEVIEQIDALIAPVEARVLEDPEFGGERFGASSTEAREARTRLMAALARLAPPGSTYLDDARRMDKGQHDEWIVPQLAGILRGLRNDYEAGYMRTVEDLVRADLFTDFIEMAEELVGKGYEDAAAVITGSVLEEHLRKLATRHSIATRTAKGFIKADRLNAELVKSGAYNKLTQKSVTAWLDSRNSAAHGDYGEYDRAQVESMIRDVRSFAERFPA